MPAVPDGAVTWAGCTVECYSGHTYAQEPRAVVTTQGQRWPVAQVEHRWRTPSGPAFRIRTEAGNLFDLHYSEADDRWMVRPLPAAEPVAEPGE